MFESASNSGPRAGSVHSPANVMAVGAYIHRDTWRANFGATVEYEDYPAGYSGRGPRGDGLLKPDVMAPTGALSAMPATYPSEQRIGNYSLPSGYRSED